MPALPRLIEAADAETAAALVEALPPADADLLGVRMVRFGPALAVMARRLDGIARLWEACAAYELGFCLDTCHFHAGGEDLAGLVDRVKAVTGRIDLVHANDSKDGFGSGRDRHENFGAGQIDPEQLLAVVAAAGAPVVCETPGGAAGQGGDIAWLRARLPR